MRGPQNSLRPTNPAVSAAARLGIPILLCVTLTGCAAYHVGNRTLYRPDLRTVYLPMIESDSYRRNLGEWLTEAVAKEIELQTPYKVVHTPNADSVMTARLLSDSKRVLAENARDEPRDIEATFLVQVNWFDRRGEILMQNTFSSGDHFIPEAGQSVVSSQQEIIRSLARQIVSQMETNAW